MEVRYTLIFRPLPQLAQLHDEGRRGFPFGPRRSSSAAPIACPRPPVSPVPSSPRLSPRKSRPPGPFRQGLGSPAGRPQYPGLPRAGLPPSSPRRKDPSAEQARQDVSGPRQDPSRGRTPALRRQGRGPDPGRRGRTRRPVAGPPSSPRTSPPPISSARTSPRSAGRCSTARTATI
jgi:hypothetical protein